VCQNAPEKVQLETQNAGITDHDNCHIANLRLHRIDGAKLGSRSYKSHIFEKWMQRYKSKNGGGNQYKK
jgi:hypothetical protein